MKGIGRAEQKAIVNWVIRDGERWEGKRESDGKQNVGERVVFTFMDNGCGNGRKCELVWKMCG